MKKGLSHFLEQCLESQEEGNAEDVAIDPVALALSVDMPHPIAGKTIDFITQEIEEVLDQYEMEEETMKKWLDKLHGYSVLSSIDDLIYGRYLRWVTYDNIGEFKLSYGGIALSVRESNNGKGKQILCRTPFQSFFYCNFDETVVFQQLSKDEMMVLLLSSHT